MHSFFELEIRTQLNKFGSAEKAAIELIAITESQPENLNKENIETLARFLNHCHLHLMLVQFVVRNLKTENFYIPWNYFLISLAEIPFEISEDFKEALMAGLIEQQAQALAVQTQKWDAIFEEFMDWRRTYKKNNKKYAQDLKNDLLDELALYRNANLVEKEKTLLQKLQKMFPKDSIIKKQLLRTKEKTALDVLAKYSDVKPSSFKKEPLSDDEKKLHKSLGLMFQNAADLHPELILDFAVACFMIDDANTALQLLHKLDTNDIESIKFKDWLEIELLLDLHHHLEVLNQLPKLEQKYAADPETFFSTAYYRAQALWGLKQKQKAIEILESLLITKPHFRLAESILNVWRSS